MIGRGIARLLHLDDQERISANQRLLSSPQPPQASSLDERTRRQLGGLLLTVLNPKKNHYETLDKASANHAGFLRRQGQLYIEHQSARPIQITWRLQYPLPGDVFVELSGGAGLRLARLLVTKQTAPSLLIPAPGFGDAWKSQE